MSGTGSYIGVMTMFKRVFSSVLVGSLLIVGNAFAEATPLEEKMDEVSGCLKSLRRAGDDYAKALVLVREAQVALIECFALSPAMIEKMPEGKEKAIAMANYKKTLAASYQTLCDLELAYLSEDEDKIDDAKDAVKKSRKDGHREFIEED